VTTAGGTATDAGAFTYYVPGLLRVTTSPALPSQITVDGNIADTWGLTWVKEHAGLPHRVLQRGPGLHHPGLPDVTVTAGGHTTVTGTFVQRGFLHVTTSPAVPGEITYTPSGGSATPMDDWGAYTDLPVGSYSVCFGARWPATRRRPASPPPLTAGATTTITGTYTVSSGASGQSGRRPAAGDHQPGPALADHRRRQHRRHLGPHLARDRPGSATPCASVRSRATPPRPARA
jgi:hypothetical protein